MISCQGQPYFVSFEPMFTFFVTALNRTNGKYVNLRFFFQSFVFSLNKAMSVKMQNFEMAN